MKLPSVAEIRKAVVAAAGVAAVLLSYGLLPDPVGKWVGIALAVLTAAGVYQVRNGPT